MTSTVRTRSEWRLGGAVLGLRLLPVLGCLVVGVWALRIRLARAGDPVAYTFVTVEALLLGVLLLAIALRTRVRLGPAGVEVREIRTRTYAWADIVWVEPTHGHRGVRLGFRDGSARTLPVPRRLGTGVADRRIDRALYAVQQQARRQMTRPMTPDR